MDLSHLSRSSVDYTAVAAIHAIILYFLDSDSRVLWEILGTSVLFAHLLQQRSQTLQKNTFGKTRFIVTFWTLLVGIAFVITDKALGNHGLVELVVVDNSTEFPLLSDTDLPCALLEGCFNDTTNPLELFVTPKQWAKSHALLRSCPTPNITFTSALRRGQSLAPDVFAGGLTFNKSYNRLETIFQIYAIVKTVGTLGFAFYGQDSMVLVRAKLYLWLRGSDVRYIAT